jgi:ElaB/YqjD/DUF883 family membrane-anchored ribosome-binding protein
MTEHDDAALAPDHEITTEDSVGFLEDFIRERPLVAVALAAMAGVFLIRRLFATRPDATK